MTREMQLLQELKELNEAGLEAYIFDGSTSRIQGHHYKELIELEEIERFISHYKKARPKLKELYKLTGDAEIYDRYYTINEHIKKLEALYIYKKMEDDFFNMPIII